MEVVPFIALKHSEVVPWFILLLANQAVILMAKNQWIVPGLAQSLQDSIATFLIFVILGAHKIVFSLPLHPNVKAMDCAKR